ncbi:MAG: amidohydrolase [Chloroflexi bacterium]|nr:MAG: amidohydrolase [Chloroflexota bacterium]
MTPNPFLTRANELREQIVAWRRQIHANPELSFQEVETAKLVAESLTEMGIETQVGVGKTGVVGFLGEGSPVIGIRADMDALPILEANDVPYKSRNPGVMHACGHDGHTAILLGVARMLSEMEDRPAGQIRFLFQPSEEASDSENKSGATRMIEDGALAGVDRVIALHVASDGPTGKVEIAGGYVTAAEDSFHIVLKGTGGHGAYPHQGTDPIFMLAQVINAIQGIRSRRIDPTKGATISIGYIHGGTVTNVIPAEVKLGGTMRSFDDDVRELMKRELARACDVAKALGGDYELRIVSGYPSTYNDPAVADLIERSAREMLGDDGLETPRAGMGAEDFSFMSRAAPGAMFMLGARLDDKNRPHHTPVFDINEDALPIGAALLADVTVKLLRGE